MFFIVFFKLDCLSQYVLHYCILLALYPYLFRSLLNHIAPLLNHTVAVSVNKDKSKVLAVPSDVHQTPCCCSRPCVPLPLPLAGDFNFMALLLTGKEKIVSSVSTLHGSLFAATPESTTVTDDHDTTLPPHLSLTEGKNIIFLGVPSCFFLGFLSPTG